MFESTMELVFGCLAFLVLIWLIHLVLIPVREKIFRYLTKLFNKLIGESHRNEGSQLNRGKEDTDEDGSSSEDNNGGESTKEEDCKACDQYKNDPKVVVVEPRVPLPPAVITISVLRVTSQA